MMPPTIMVVSLTDGTQVSNAVSLTDDGDLHVMTMLGFLEPQFVVKRESAIAIAKEVLRLLEA